jgi:hypothetical protein
MKDSNWRQRTPCPQLFQNRWFLAADHAAAFQKCKMSHDKTFCCFQNDREYRPGFSKFCTRPSSSSFQENYSGGLFLMVKLPGLSVGMAVAMAGSSHSQQALRGHQHTPLRGSVSQHSKADLGSRKHVQHIPPQSPRCTTTHPGQRCSADTPHRVPGYGCQVSHGKCPSWVLMVRTTTSKI